MVNRYIKRCSTSWVTREIQTKPTMRYHSIPTMTAIIFLKRKMTNVGEDVGKMGPECLAGGDRKWHSSCRKHFRISSKSETQSHYTIPAIPLLAQENWKHTFKQNLAHKYIVIHHSQKAETTQMPISWWTDKQNVVHLYCGLHSAVRRSEALISLNTDRAWKHDATGWKAGPKGYTLIPCRGNVQKGDECQGPEGKRRGSDCLKDMAFPFGTKKMF